MLHSIHALPEGSEFVGTIEAGRSKFGFSFKPASASIENGKLTLRGRVKVTPPKGSPRTTDGVTATLLSTQGSTAQPPAPPASLPAALIPTPPANPGVLPITEATGYLASIAVIYFRLSPLSGTQLGLPLDLGAVQLNARLYSDSTLERELLWLYSALLMATLGPLPDAARAQGLLAELNRRYA